MGKITTFACLIACFCISVAAQSAAPQSKKSNDVITAKGCVAKQATDYILTQADQGNSYQLQATGKLRFRHYLGQEVEVTGEKVATLGTSSDYLARTGVASPETIIVDSIKIISQRCSGN